MLHYSLRCRPAFGSCRSRCCLHVAPDGGPSQRAGAGAPAARQRHGPVRRQPADDDCDLTSTSGWGFLIVPFVSAGRASAWSTRRSASTPIGVVPHERSGMASASTDLRQVGIATGIAGLGRSSRTTDHPRHHLHAASTGNAHRYWRRPTGSSANCSVGRNQDPRGTALIAPLPGSRSRTPTTPGSCRPSPRSRRSPARSRWSGRWRVRARPQPRLRRRAGAERGPGGRARDDDRCLEPRAPNARARSPHRTAPAGAGSAGMPGRSATAGRGRTPTPEYSGPHACG